MPLLQRHFLFGEDTKRGKNHALHPLLVSVLHPRLVSSPAGINYLLPGTSSW
jgi:hypothetical protein